MTGDLAGDALGALDVDVADPDLGALGREPAAIAAPMPLAPPVTSAFLPSSLMPSLPQAALAGSIDWRARG